METNNNEHIPTPMELFGVECGKGWYKLIEPVVAYIEEYNKNRPDEEKIAILQIKEKYAELRIYVSYGTDELYDMISDAEDKSHNICEVCGAEENVGLKISGWYMTMCQDCAKEMAKNKEYPIVWERNSDGKTYRIYEDGKIEEIKEEEKP